MSSYILQLPHLADHVVYTLLFKDVKNATFLRQQLLAGKAEFEYAFLDAAKILSVNHALSAVFRALNDSLHNRLKSRNVHSEIVFSLSPNNNIAESFRRFGILDTTTSVLAIKVLHKGPEGEQQADPEAHLKSVVEGTVLEFNNESINQVSDLPRIRKLYKLDAPVPLKAGKRKPGKGVDAAKIGSATKINEVHAELDDVLEMEAVVLGIMALKGS